VIDRLDEIQEDVERMEHRRARSPSEGSRFRQCLRAICLDLFHAYDFDPSEEIGVHRGHSALTRNPRYPAFVTARTFLNALDGLERAGYLKVLSLGTEASNRTSRVRATERLIKKVDVSKGVRADIGGTDDSIRVLISQGKGKPKQRVSFVETDQTSIWRQNLAYINKSIESFFVDLDFRNFRDEYGRDSLFTEKEERDTRLKTDFESIRLYRVFNSADFSTGGRFYGGWWINLKSEFRKFITISGKDTCEHDFSHIHPMLLYAEIGRELPREYDPYSVPHGLQLRGAVKKAFNIMLNGKRKPIQSMVPEFEPNSAGMSWARFLDGILEAHRDIESQFFSGAGGRLQRRDSDIAEAILIEFAKGGYPCLPVHDSFITYKSLDDEVPEIMSRVTRNLFGVSGYSKRKESISYLESVMPGHVENDIDEILDSIPERERRWLERN
jgi:hypothetical protein